VANISHLGSKLFYRVPTSSKLKVFSLLTLVLPKVIHSSLNATNKTIVTLSSSLCQCIVNLVECNREIDEREAQAKE
jgi:hypothetical protein